VYSRRGGRERSVFIGGLRCLSCSIHLGVSHEGWSERCVWFVEHVHGREFSPFLSCYFFLNLSWYSMCFGDKVLDKIKPNSHGWKWEKMDFGRRFLSLKL